MNHGSIKTTLLFTAAVLGFAPPTAAAEGYVSASSDVQLYDVPNPYGTRSLRIRRATHTLGLRVYDLLDRLPGAPELLFVTRLRLDADYGVGSTEVDPTRRDSYVPGLEEDPIDLMYGYLEGRSWLGGWLGFRLGRQYVTDALGWWSFDGSLVRVTTGTPLAFEVYGGFEQRGGLPLLATSRFTADGVQRGSRRDLEANQWPSYLEEERPAPAYGFAVEAVDLRWLSARVSYRRVINRDSAIITMFPDRPDTFEVVREPRVSSERLGGTAVLTSPALGSIDGTVVYDLYRQRYSEHGVGVTWLTAPRVTLAARYDYSLPTFDGDSIFNWFSAQGMTTATVDATWTLGRHTELGGSFGGRRFTTEDASTATAASESATEADAAPGAIDALGSLAGRYWWPQGDVELHSVGEAGDGGHRLGTDLTVRRGFAGGFYDTLATISLYDWRDDLRPGRSATSFTYVLGGGLHPSAGSRIGLEWEHTTNQIVGQRVRLLATIAFRVAP